MDKPLAGPLFARRSLLLAGLGAAVSAPAFAQATGTRVGTNPEAGQSVSLDSWVDAYGRPTAKVMLNGAGPFDFLVDTGANTTVMTMRRALQIGATLDGVATVNGTTGAAQMPVTTIEHLATGAVNASNLRVAVIEDKALQRQDGILGADVFAGMRLSFDIQHRRVLVETSQRRRIFGGRYSMSSNLHVRNKRLAEIDGFIGRIRVRMMLDTGADNCIINPALDAELAKAFPRIKRVERATVVGVTGQILVGQYVGLPDIRFGNVTLRDAGGVVSDAPIFQLWDLRDTPAMIVGVNVLSRLAGFSIDYGAQTFEATPLALLAGQRIELG
ncbi:MAG: hypothetical protein GC155_00820 [Alphaproteobacteria bacterium]|nr:hypothetical protein [Alphaproteobacteria bacterium]